MNKTVDDADVLDLEFKIEGSEKVNIWKSHFEGWLDIVMPSSTSTCRSDGDGLLTSILDGAVATPFGDIPFHWELTFTALGEIKSALVSTNKSMPVNWKIWLKGEWLKILQAAFNDTKP